MESNKRSIDSQNFLEIANVVGASVDYFLCGEVAETPGLQPIVIPLELSQAVEELELSYTATIELLEAHRSVIARRSHRGLRKFGVNDWKKLHEAIRNVFG